MLKGNQQNDPHMQNFPYGDDQMHLGIPECIRIEAEKLHTSEGAIWDLNKINFTGMMGKNTSINFFI